MVGMFQTNLLAIFRADLVGNDYTELRNTLSLIEGYLIMGGLDFVASFGDTFATLFHLTVGQVRPRAAPHAIRPVEALLLLAGNSSNLQEVMEYLVTTDVLTLMIRPCLAALGSVSCSDDVAAVATYASIANHFESSQESDIALISYLSVCARCIILNTSFMVSCCHHVLQASSPTVGLLAALSTGAAGGGGGDAEAEAQAVGASLI
jgi:hypothetical protein